MEAETGYWIDTTSAGTLTVCGPAPSPALSLAEGWNLVGYNGIATRDGIKGPLLPRQRSRRHLELSWSDLDSTRPERSAREFILTRFCPNNGYWIKVDGAGTCQRVVRTYSGENVIIESKLKGSFKRPIYPS